METKQTPSREQEAALIGAVLRRPMLLEELMAIIKPGAFEWQPYRKAWEAMLSLRIQEISLDTVTLADELERKNNLADWQLHDRPSNNGKSALSYLREMGQPQNARDYAANVVDYAAKRQLLEIASEMARYAANGRKAQDILTDIEKKLATVNTGNAIAKSTITLRDAIRQAVQFTDDATNGKVKYTPSGYRDLDNIITGFMAPDMTIIAGRPGQGKTALLASIAQNILKQGKRIAFFSLEMGSQQVGMRFISMVSGVSYQKQMTGKLTEQEWDNYNNAVEDLGSGNYGLYLNDLPAITPSKIRQELRRLGGVDMFMVDYLQLAQSDERRENRHLEVAAVARDMKNICKEFQIPGIIAAQLSRAAEQRAGDDKRPILSDLGESSELEKAADKVIFIHRPNMDSVNAEIIVAKQRNGPVGMCGLAYIGYKTRFEGQAKA